MTIFMTIPLNTSTHIFTLCNNDRCFDVGPVNGTTINLSLRSLTFVTLSLAHFTVASQVAIS